MRKWKWSWWSLLWAAWIVLFFAIEIPAVLNGSPDDTLSEHVWHLLSIGSVFWFLVAGLLIWLLYHFLWEGRNRK